jgi:hypothetical protein
MNTDALPQPGPDPEDEPTPNRNTVPAPARWPVPNQFEETSTAF